MAALGAFLLMVLLFVVATRLGFFGASASECKYEPITQLPIRYHGRTLDVTVEGEINGTPAILLPDTGSPTLLTPFGLDKRRMVRAWKSGRMFGIGGSSQTYSVPIKDLSMGPLKVRGLGFVRLFDETGIRPEFDAIVGADYLLGMDVELNFLNKQIKFFKATNCGDAFLAYWDTKAVRVPLLYAMKGKLPVIEVKLDGVSLRALIDTGSGSTSISTHALPKLGLSVKSDGMLPIGSSGGIGAARARNYRYRFKNFSIEHETIQNPEILVVEVEREDKEIDILLGNDFMRTHRILLAPSQNKVYISYLGGTPFSGGLEDWVVREAEQGNHYAQYRVAMSEGSDIARDGSPWMKKSLEQGNPLALRYRARMLQKAGRTADALPLFERAIEHDPFYMPAQLQVFRARVEVGQVVQAKAKLTAALNGLDESRWPIIIASYYLGNVGLDRLMSEAGSVQQLAQARRCEAYQYVGLLLAVQRDMEAAKSIAAKRRSECGTIHPI